MIYAAIETLQAQVARLERRLRFFYRLLLAAAFCVAAAAAISLSAQEKAASAVLRARSLVIEDEQGRARIVIGAPVPDPKEGKRRSPSIGLVIDDREGYERFGLGLAEDGTMGMGFDAPPGTGDRRNREGINIVADRNGGAYIRFLNRKTFVAGRLQLDRNDRFSLEFLDFPEGEVAIRRIAFKGDETVRDKR